MKTDQTNKREGKKAGLLIAVLSAFLIFLSVGSAHATASASHHTHPMHPPELLHALHSQGPKQHLTHIMPHCEARGHHLLSENCPHRASGKNRNRTMLTTDCHQGSKQKGTSADFSVSFAGEPQGMSIIDRSPKKSNRLIPGFPLYITLIEPPNPPPKIS